jgi:hypothetical protein
MSDTSSIRSWDRRLIYLLVTFSLVVPLLFDFTLAPAPLASSNSFFDVVDKLEKKDDQIVFVALDWGPSTQAENKSQTLVALEHLMRRRIPFALISITPYASPFLINVPLEVAAKLEAESPGERWQYGSDWVNLGYQPNTGVMIQGLARSANLRATLRTDAFGTSLEDIPCFRNISTIRQVPLLMEFTGLVGGISAWLQFFQGEEYRPDVLHGCTSITIPEAHNYLASKQLLGAHEGLAGAAWYDKLLSDKFPNRQPGAAIKLNTSLANAQLLIIALIVIGNASYFMKTRGRR